MANSRDKVRVGDSIIEYEIRRSARRKKTIQIQLEGQSVVVAAPVKTTITRLREIVRDRADWILSRTANPPPEVPRRTYLDGETLPYLGAELYITCETCEGPAVTVRLGLGSLLIAAPKGLAGEERAERVHEAVMRWYFAQAADRFSESVNRWRPKLGVSHRPRVLIRPQRRRWGSCSSDGTLRFNWRAVMLDTALLDYLVVHELAHLTHMDHSANFWALVTQVMPDAKQRRRRLQEEGRALPL